MLLNSDHLWISLYSLLYILYSGFKFSTSFWEVSHNLWLPNPIFFLLQFLFLIVQYLICGSDPFFFSVCTEALVLILLFRKVLWPKGYATFIWDQWNKGTEGKAPFNRGTFFGWGRDPDSSAACQHPAQIQSLSGISSFQHKGLKDRESQGGKIFPPASLSLIIAPLPHFSVASWVLVGTAGISALRMQHLQQVPVVTLVSESRQLPQWVATFLGTTSGAGSCVGASGWLGGC